MNKQEIEKAIETLKKYHDLLLEVYADYSVYSKAENYSDKSLELASRANTVKNAVGTAITHMSQQLNNGWILVSERLPEIRQLYDVSLRYENFSGIYEITRMADYIGDGEWNIYGPQPVIATRHIMAWKNRTEPYKGVSE